MNSKPNTGLKLLVVVISLVLSVIGFMIKLPSQFRHIDKEMHAAFYFAAAAFLNFLFGGRNLIRHLLIFGILFLFSISIEYAQEYSNKYFHSRIHGRYDPEDVKYNLMGLVSFSAIWAVYMIAVSAFKKIDNRQ